MTLTATVGGTGRPSDAATEASDEALSARLRDLALVELDALAMGQGGLVVAFADDLADALGEARARIGVLRAQLGGADPLNVLDVSVRQRASDAGPAGAARVRSRLVAQAGAARALARLAELAAPLIPRLVEADRRR